MNAIDFLERAADLMRERGAAYDKPNGVKSMMSAVEAFNCITGRDLTEEEGWAFMLMVKLSRQWQRTEWHRDSAEDAVAYAALMAEAGAATRT